MNRTLSQFTIRFNSLSLRERILSYFVCFALIFAIWYLLLWNPSAKKRIFLNEQIPKIEQQITDLSNSLLEAQNRLQTASKLVSEKKDQQVKPKPETAEIISRVKQQLATPQQMSDILEELMTSKHDLQLLEIQNIPGKMLGAPGDKDTFFEHGLIMKFSGDYFATLHYLQEIESLPWHFYWDKLDYKVTKYPLAEIIVQLHIISGNKGWLHA